MNPLSIFKSKEWTISHYLMLFFLIIGISVSGLITIFFYNAASIQVMGDITQRLNDIVSISSTVINTELHSNILYPSQQNSQEYMKLKKKLQDIKAASSDIHFIYTMRQTPDNKIMFVVDAESNPVETANLGDIYNDASPLLKREFAALKKPLIEKNFYKDKWGVWLSGYAPFFSEDGTRAGVLGVDISAATVENYRQEILTLALEIFLFSIPFILIAGWFLGMKIGAPIIDMKKKAEAIAEGALDTQLEIPAGRELAVLAKSLNSMSRKLKEEQQNLKNMAVKYRNIFDNSMDGIFQVSVDGELITANKAMISMMRYESLEEMRELLSGRIGNIYVDTRDRERLISELLERDHVKAFPVHMKRRDGSCFWAEVNAKLYDYLDGRKIIEGNLKDISTRLEKEKAERKIEAAEAASLAKSEFLANMSHEIRTPLNAVMGLTDLLMKTKMTDRQQNYLKKIKASSQSLLAVINDILDFSKIEAGYLELEEINFSLFDVMANISEMFGFKAHEKDIELLVSIDENTPSAVIGDPVRLGQILINLVGNAFKFTEQGEIVVHVRELKRKTLDDGAQKICLEFTIQDSGTGIPHDRLDTLFDSFTQADNSTTRKYGGTGLGLSISKKLTKLMGGDIRVTSEPGRGSIFIFTISVKKQPEKAQVSLTPPRDLRGLKVLIVDDNKTSLDILSSAITSFKMKAVTASSGPEAIELIQKTKTPFDFILMDWKMPKMNGIETAKKIKTTLELEKIPIVCMVSAYGREDLIQQADKHVLDAFLHKPVNQSLLFDTIMELFGRHDAVVTTQAANSHVCSRPDEFLKGMNILLVEDNEINQEVAMEWLGSAGINTSTAFNGREALEKLQQYMPDAVLMDIQMPEMDGFEAARRIREDKRFDDLPVIAMTAHALKGDREKCLEAGMNDHITKPIDPDKLFSTLSFWIRKNPGRTEQAQKEKSDPENEKKTTQNLTMPDLTLTDFTLPGIDVKSGLFRANNNKKLYLKLLKTFRRDFGHALKEIRHSLDKDDMEAARRLAHSIKGVSANIGAVELSAAAARAETEITAYQRLEDAAWEDFSINLDTVITGLDTIHKNIPAGESKQKKSREKKHSMLNEPETTSAEPKVSSSLENIPLILEKIIKINSLLDDDLNMARETLEAIEPELRLIIDDDSCDELIENIDNFEIDEASELLKKMENILRTRNN